MELQNLLDRIIADYSTSENIITILMEKKLEESGIVLNNAQLDALKDQIKNKKLFEKGSFEFNEEEALKFPTDLKTKASISININSHDLSDFEKRFKKIIEELVPEIVESATKEIHPRLRKHSKNHIKNLRKDLKQFGRHIEQIWGRPLDLLELFRNIATDSVTVFNGHLNTIITEKNNFVIDALIRLHARSCQIAAEIIILLRNGFADGAQARWRTMHEIAVIAHFISEHGNDVAEKYLCHHEIFAFNAAIKYQEQCLLFGGTKLSECEVDELRERHDYLVNKYGANYKNHYGWCSCVIGKERPTFADIEADIGLSNMRPYYQKASHNVHATPEGLFFKLGLMPEGEDILLTGPSNIGLAQPGNWAAISLLQVTTTLLTISPVLDLIVICNILKTLEKELSDLFYSIENEFFK